jgi:serine/threonine protein kinase
MPGCEAMDDRGGATRVGYGRMFVCPECGTSSVSRAVCGEHATPMLDAKGDPLLGTQVGSYRIARVLGEGGMGVVYLGVHPRIESRVAIKVMAHGLADDPGVMARFFEEARASNLIDHEGVVKITDLAQLADGRPYIVMEHLSGETLRSHLAARGRLSPAEAQRIIAPILGALHAAHRRGIIHRDVKPANVFLPAVGGVKLLDFGIAKLLPSVRRYGNRTATGVSLGTPAYKAPELVVGGEVDARTDVYAVGVVLYEMVTGRRPFQGADVELRHLDSEPPSPRSLEPRLSESLERVILRALAKAPDARFITALAFRDALLAADPALLEPRRKPPPTLVDAPPAAAPLPAAAPPTLLMTPPPARRTPPPARHWPLLLAAGAVAFALAALAAYSFTGGEDEDQQAPVASASVAPTSASSARVPTAPAIPTSPSELARFYNIDNRAFDPVAFFPSALALARSRLPRSELESLMTSGVREDGTVDLTERQVRYWFVHAVSGLYVDILIGDMSVELHGPAASSRVRPIPPPRCRMSTVVATARRDASNHRGTPHAMLDLRASGTGAPEWRVTLLWGPFGKTSHRIADDGACSSTLRQPPGLPP